MILGERNHSIDCAACAYVHARVLSLFGAPRSEGPMLDPLAKEIER